MRVYAVMQREELCDETFSDFARSMTSGIFLCRKNAERHLKSIRNKKDSLGIINSWAIVRLDIETDIRL